MTNLPRTTHADPTIRRHLIDPGWAVISIPADTVGTLPYMHTVGLVRWDHPEVLIFGLPAPTATAILNTVGDAVSRGRRFRPATHVTGLLDNNTTPLRFTAMKTRLAKQYTPTLQSTNRNTPQVLQLLWPDADGQWPDEPRFHHPDRQPVYSTLPSRWLHLNADQATAAN